MIILMLYSVRVFFLQGWYIITYALAIYLLNLFIAFLSPKFDPAFDDDEELGKLINVWVCVYLVMVIQSLYF